MIPSNWLQEASSRIAPYIVSTPLTYDKELDLYLKWESHQKTGSFKLRGALNKVLSLQPGELEKGLVAASAGNHGQGVAFAGNLVKAPVIIFASEHAVHSKVEAMRKLGAEVRFVPGGYGEAEQAGIAYANEIGATWVSPYNDYHVIAGQGTLGTEILQQLLHLKELTWVVPVGGGGLISGIAWAISAESKQASDDFISGHTHHRLIGVQSEASPFFHAIFWRHTQADVVEYPSLADGLSGPVEANSLTIPIVQQTVEDFFLVNEAEIVQAIVFSWKRYGEIIEGSAATAMAAILTGKILSRPAVVVLSGGNIQPEVHAALVA